MVELQHLQRLPAYCLHKPTCQAYSTAPATNTQARRPVYFGLWGTADSLTAYSDFLRGLGFPADRCEQARTEAQAKSQRPAEIAAPLPADHRHCTVKQLWSEFNRWAKGYYLSAAGLPTGEADNYAQSVRQLLELFGSDFVADFNRRKLEQVRQAMVDRRLCRSVVNTRTNKIKRIFRWGTEEGRELVPESVAASLILLRNLPVNRTAARDHPPVRGVDPELVKKAAAASYPVIRAMLLLQLHTGMRPGEVRGLRKCMVQQIDGHWFADFGNEHKTAFRKHKRVVALGPKSVKILKEWLPKCPSDTEYVFRPSLRKGNRIKSDKFHRSNYIDFLKWACIRAKIPKFAPNQIRHTAAEEIRKSDGLEAVQAVLGHKSRASSERYAPAVAELATVIAKKRG